MEDPPKQQEVIPPDHRIEGHVPLRYRVRFGWFILAGILLLSAIALFYIPRRVTADKKKTSAEAAKKKAGGVTVSVVSAKKGTIGVYLEAIGTVTPVHTVSLTSQVNGVVTEVKYKEGQLVHPGDPMIEIDARPYRATLQQAQGSLERDQSLLEQAQMDLDRYRTAWQRNAIAKQILDDQEKLVAQDRGIVKNDQGTVDYDQVQVDFCHITAPIGGRVGLRLVDPGNVVQASGGTTLAVIAQLQPITIVFTIPEDNLGQVQTQIAHGATLAVEAYDRAAQKKIATGRFLTLDNQIDTTTGTVKGRAEFDNANNALFPNEFVNTRLLVTTLRNITLIPSSAIQQNGNTSFVYVIEKSYAHLRKVTPGVSDAGNTQVTGVNPGDVLADSSFDKLQDNTEVMVSHEPVASDSGVSQPSLQGVAGKGASPR